MNAFAQHNLTVIGIRVPVLATHVFDHIVTFLLEQTRGVVSRGYHQGLIVIRISGPVEWVDIKARG